jgi:hypothetical protein
MAIILKGCARCGGDLFPEQQGYDFYMTCLQCSRHTSHERRDDLEPTVNGIDAYRRPPTLGVHHVPARSAVALTQRDYHGQVG